MIYDSYASLSAAVNLVGLTAEQSGPDQLIVSTQSGPVWPDRGNSFWFSLQSGAWYLCTWTPACYRIPPDQDLVELSLECIDAGSSAMSQVPDPILTRFGLARISEEEFEALFGKESQE